MNAATEVQTGFQPVHEAATLKTKTRGVAMESIGAVATIALAIVGLAGVFPMTLAAIATIVLGAALWIEGGMFAATYKGALYRERAEALFTEWGQGLTIEFLGGLGGIVLGILALLGVVPMTLLSVGALVFGGTFLFNSEAGIGSRSEGIFGLAGLTLGLLAVTGRSPLTLVLVALACLGASALFSGAETGVKMAMRK